MRKTWRSWSSCALENGIGRAGAHKDYASTQKKMTGLKPVVYKPNAKAHATYRELFSLYKKLHDAFGTRDANGNLYDVMKKLIEIRSRVRK